MEILTSQAGMGNGELGSGEWGMENWGVVDIKIPYFLLPIMGSSEWWKNSLLPTPYYGR
ncbi:hypothetical protein [Nostoc sp.]